MPFKVISRIADVPTFNFSSALDYVRWHLISMR